MNLTPPFANGIYGPPPSAMPAPVLPPADMNTQQQVAYLMQVQAQMMQQMMALQAGQTPPIDGQVGTGDVGRRRRSQKRHRRPRNCRTARVARSTLSAAPTSMAARLSAISTAATSPR